MDTIARTRWNELVDLADKGDAEAQWEVGYYHEFGATDEAGNVLAPADPLRARRWYTLSAEQGNEKAQCALSCLLSTGESVEPDLDAAIHWGEKAVAQGSASAAFNLGTIYRDQNKPEMAFRWYERAAAMGDTGAFLDLGLCSLFGFGTKRDAKEAYRCFTRGIEEGRDRASQRTEENALYWMAVLELMGMGNAKQGAVARARKMLESANADDDHEQANDILNIIGKSKYLSLGQTER